MLSGIFLKEIWVLYICVREVYRIHILIIITIIDLMRKIGYNTDIQKRENLEEMKCWKI